MLDRKHAEPCATRACRPRPPAGQPAAAQRALLEQFTLDVAGATADILPEFADSCVV